MKTFIVIAPILLLGLRLVAEPGLAPEVTDLKPEEISYQMEQNLPDLKKPYLSASPTDRKDGITVGKLGPDGGNKDIVMGYAESLAKKPANDRAGHTDSLLIGYKGKLIFESYYRRGRANYPHYQMSSTKSYTAMAVGRAMQLGHLTMKDLDQPVISFLKDIKPDTLVKGADGITLHQAMHMSSGIRVPKAKLQALMKTPELLKGQGQVQAYLTHSAPIPPAPRGFKYQGTDPSIAMQVMEAVVPGRAEKFIRDELLKPMGITSYNWQEDVSGLPKAAAGSSLRSRDMLKMGLLVLNKGKWQGKQLIPEAFVERATSPIKLGYGKSSYGYFWWVEDCEVGGKTYHGMQGRGAGGQFIFMFPELDLVVVVTAHNKGMGTLLRRLPQKLIPAFTGN